MLIKKNKVDVEGKMFRNDMKYRPFSFGEGIRGMRSMMEEMDKYYKGVLPLSASPEP